MSGFAVFDLETTGLSPQTERIIEVCILLVNEQGEQEGKLVTLINPGIRIPAAASAINGITDSMVAGSPVFADVAANISAALHGRVLVGHNIKSFDIPFLEAEFQRAGRAWTRPTALDTLRLARKAYPSLKSHSLRSLCAAAGLQNTAEHRAEGDSQVSWTLLCMIAEDDIDDLTDLDKFSLPVPAYAMPEEMVARKPQKAVPDTSLAQTCTGEVVVFTGGKPPGYTSRTEAANEVVRRGGRASSTVSKKTTIVFAGDNAGSKLDRARDLGIPIYAHAEFQTFLAAGRSAVTQRETVITRFEGYTEILGAQVAQLDATAEIARAGTARPAGTAQPATETSKRSDYVVSSDSSDHLLLAAPTAPSRPADVTPLPAAPANDRTTHSAPADLSDQQPPPSSPAAQLRPPPARSAAQTSALADYSLPTALYEHRLDTAAPAEPPPAGRTAPYVAKHSSGGGGNAARSNRMTVAVLLAVFLGIFGAHRFYLGLVPSGAIMLGLTVLSLGFLAPFVFVFALVDAIRVATGRLPD